MKKHTHTKLTEVIKLLAPLTVIAAMIFAMYHNLTQ